MSSSSSDKDDVSPPAATTTKNHRFGGFMEEMKKAKEEATHRMKQNTERLQSNASKFLHKHKDQSKDADAAAPELVKEEGTAGDPTTASSNLDTTDEDDHHDSKSKRTLNPVKMAKNVAHSIERTAEKTLHSIEKTAEKTKDAIHLSHHRTKIEEVSSNQSKDVDIPEPSEREEEEEPLLDETSAGASMKAESRRAPKKTFPALNLPSGDVTKPLDDEMIVAIIVFSFAISSLLHHWREMLANEMPASVVFTFSVLSFYAGQYIEPTFWKRAFSEYFLGLPEESEMHTERTLDVSPCDIATVEKPNFFRTIQKAPTKAFSTLSKKTHLPKVQNNKLMAKLLANPMFRRKKSSSALASAEDQPESTVEQASAEHPKHTLQHMGSMEASDMQNPKASSVNTLCHFRGMDVFLTEDAEEKMGDHPFLIENKLRTVPTLMVNLMTQWGTVLFYFELPDWVKDFGESLKETANDSDPVKALKRFLSAEDDEYRKRRLFLTPEIVEAAYAIKMVAPKGKDLQLQKDGLTENYYHFYENDGHGAPLVEVTLDMVGNKAIRGMASLVKRYLVTLSIDFAAVVRAPENSTTPEPEACLGLFRLHHLDVNAAPTLPDRYSYGKSASMGKADELRASMLVKEASIRMGVPVRS
jgi:hypothetical protein